MTNGSSELKNMITSAQLAELKTALDGDIVPGFAVTQGNTTPTANLKSYLTITTNTKASVFYDPVNNRVCIKGNNVTVSGYNFSGTQLEVWGNNVTVKNCTFDDAVGSYAVVQETGYSGLTLTNNTFNGSHPNSPQGMFVNTATGYANVSDNVFVNANSHDIQVSDGIVSNNYISGGGLMPGDHADAIAVLQTTGPVMISGNYIDWTNSEGSEQTNNAIRIETEQGNVSNVTVENNILLGGQTTVAAGNDGIGTFSNVKIDNNYIGLYTMVGIEPAQMGGVTTSGNVAVGFTNPTFSSQAWSSYLASGIVTTHLVVATGAGNNITGAATGSSTLYGDGTVESLRGTANETVFVGGFGSQYLYGGSGKDIFTYLSIADSTASPGHTDIISNFDPTKDVIDISRIDANLSQAGVQNFTFVGTAAFSAAGGQVRYEQNAATNITYVEADLVSDSTPDLEIEIKGLVNLTAANFTLTAAHSAAATAPAPEVTSVTDSALSADLDAGKVVTLKVNFSGAVNVAGGVPTLSLNDGGTAVYKSGSGTSALTFAYTVAAGQNTSALAVTAISLQGATIENSIGANAVLTGAVGSLPTSLQIDTKTPTVTALSATAPSGDLNAGKTATLTVAFSEAVKVSGGTPSLTLNDGGTATYVSGSGSNALTFSYTVAAGQNTANLTVAALSLNGATIADGAGNVANLAGAKGGLGMALMIDTTAPTVYSVRASAASGHELTTGQTTQITLTMIGTGITVTGAPVLLLNDGATATYDKALSTATAVVFDYTAGNETTTGLAAAGIEFASGSSIADQAGNVAVLSNASGQNTGLTVNTNQWAPDASSVGNFTVTASSALELFGASTANVTFAASATGMLTLDNSHSFAGTVAGLAHGDSIDLADIGYVAGSFKYATNGGGTGGVLTIGSGTHMADIALLGSYLASNFATSSDGHGGTLVTDTAVSVAHAIASSHS